MAINKIIVDGVTKIDLSQDTVTTDKVLEGLTFHDATGSLCTGTMAENTGSGSVDVGDITLYTKLAYTYDEYINNSSTAGCVTAYFEDGTSSSYSIGYAIITSGGSLEDAYNSHDYQLAVPTSGRNVYVFSTKKITSVDVEFGGGCGC